MKSSFLLLAACICSLASTAQDNKTGTEKGKHAISISTDGIDIHNLDSDGKSKKEEKAFSIEFAMVDVGINSLQDNTDYTSTEAQSFLQVPAALRNENLFSMRTSKSLNINIYPLTARWRAFKTRNQKMYISSGIGLQIYNFRFNKDISYVNETVPMIINDSVQFSKNKLAVSYLNIPLMVTFKTRLADKAWLVYGAGITAGYRIDSWTKQVSDERGKKKFHDPFNLKDFNTCLTGEIGLDNYFRLYASYQLTSLHETALDQHPFCIGIRFGGN